MASCAIQGFSPCRLRLLSASSLKECVTLLTVTGLVIGRGGENDLVGLVHKVEQQSGGTRGPAIVVGLNDSNALGDRSRDSKEKD